MVCLYQQINPLFEQLITATVGDLRAPELCILVHILPQVYNGEAGREHMGLIYSLRTKRPAPILVSLLVGLRIAGSVAVGTASFVVNNANFKVLSKQVDEDLEMLERSVHQLESTVDSLAEVVLQNRRGLDLLFMKQERLCMALSETCCFYANK